MTDPRNAEKTMPRSIIRRSLHDEVVDSLREMIVTGRLRPGDRIVEKDLSEQLGVSRTPIREAIKILTLDGLVDSQAHRGAVVKALDRDDIENLFDVIAVLEALAAERAATNLTPREMKKLETLHGRMRTAFDNKNRARYFEINSEIHDFLVAHCANEILFEMRDRLMLRARRGRYLAISSEDRWAEAMQQHEDLMEALRAGDGAAASTIWRAHLKMTGTVLLQSLEAGAAD